MFLAILSVPNVVAMIVGTALGIVIGAAPGLTATMGVALGLPFTFGMPPLTGMLFLLGIYCGGIYGGSITAILIRTPGTPAAACTALDGYPLARQGQALKALQMATYASTIGGLISVVALVLVAPQLAKIALRFGPPECFAVAMFGMTIIVAVSASSIRGLTKGLIAGLVGFLISTIGLDPITGAPRFTFGTPSMESGIQLVPALIGLFAVSEVLVSIETQAPLKFETADIAGDRCTSKDVLTNLRHIVKGSLIGCFIGATPGTGAVIASFLSYNEARRVSRHPEKFGHGSLEGVAASESANNGVTGATLIPLLTLGIPGDTVTAVLLGALMIQGLSPGPLLFQKHGDLVKGIMLGLVVINVVMCIEGLGFSRAFFRVIYLPRYIVMPIVLALCIVGSYAVNNSLFDVEVMVAFGAIGYLARKAGYPVTPVLLGIVLGPIVERSFRQSMILSGGSPLIFISRPISAFVLVLAVISAVGPILKMVLRSAKATEGGPAFE